MNVVARRACGAVEAFTLGFGPLGPPMMTVTFYLVEGTLVDTGQSRMREAALALLEGRRIDRILLTHHHEDHGGNAAAFQRRHGAPVLAHPLTAEAFRSGFRLRPYQRFLWGRSEPAAVEPIGGSIEAGRFRFLPLHTPGHSPDHTVFLEPDEGWLFSGDLFLGERIKFFRADERFHDQIVSIRRVLRLDFDALFCGHNPVVRGGRARLAAKLAFLEELYGEIRRRKARGETLSAVIRALDPRLDRRVKLITGGNASFAHMVRSAYHDDPPADAVE